MSSSDTSRQIYPLSSFFFGNCRLVGNPVCSAQISHTSYCQEGQQLSTPYSTSLAHCGPKICSPNERLNPRSCVCACPYEGLMVFRAPFFRDVTNDTIYQSLETSLWTKLDLSNGSVSVQNPSFNDDGYLEVQLKLFPSPDIYFNRTEILRIGFDLSNQTYKPPLMFGPYYFIATPYPFPGDYSIIFVARRTLNDFLS